MRRECHLPVQKVLCLGSLLLCPFVPSKEMHGIGHKRFCQQGSFCSVYGGCFHVGAQFAEGLSQYHQWAIDYQVFLQKGKSRLKGMCGSMGWPFNDNDMWMLQKLARVRNTNYTEGRHLAEPTLKIFEAKIMSHLLYGVTIAGRNLMYYFRIDSCVRYWQCHIIHLQHYTL